MRAAQPREREGLDCRPLPNLRALTATGPVPEAAPKSAPEPAPPEVCAGIDEL